MILTARRHSITPHAQPRIATRPTNKSVPLQALVILDVLGELAQRIASCRALCATKERHDLFFASCVFLYSSLVKK